MLVSFVCFPPAPSRPCTTTRGICCEPQKKTYQNLPSRFRCGIKCQSHKMPSLMQGRRFALENQSRHLNVQRSAGKSVFKLKVVEGYVKARRMFDLEFPSLLNCRDECWRWCASGKPILCEKISRRLGSSLVFELSSHQDPGVRSRRWKLRGSATQEIARRADWV